MSKASFSPSGDQGSCKPQRRKGSLGQRQFQCLSLLQGAKSSLVRCLTGVDRSGRPCKRRLGFEPKGASGSDEFSGSQFSHSVDKISVEFDGLREGGAAKFQLCLQQLCSRDSGDATWWIFNFRELTGVKVVQSVRPSFVHNKKSVETTCAEFLVLLLIRGLTWSKLLKALSLHPFPTMWSNSAVK